ncbi:MAG: hypothetical protein KC613_21260, partial [Myxococcales bacterium]|nr:hypothetical protein [Myxococcales bacterium]
MGLNRIIPTLTAAAVALALAAPAWADEVEGVVVAVDGGEIVLDVGRRQGVAPKTTLRLYRRLVVQHPVSGEQLEDRFPIGEVQPAEIGERLTIVRKPTKLARPP